MKNGSPGNLSIGQGISRFLFAASCGGRTTPGFPGQISEREGWRRWGGGLQVHCHCHDRQRYGMLGEISGRALAWLKVSGLIRWRLLPFSVELRYFCTTAQPNRTITCSALAANGMHFPLPGPQETGGPGGLGSLIGYLA